MNLRLVMSRVLAPRAMIVMVLLVAAWCALWREISVANVLSGLVVGTLTIGSGAATAFQGPVRPIALIRLGWLVAADLARATINVATEILTPGDQTEESVVAITLPPEGRRHLLLFVISITLTPGTAVVDADVDTGTLYLHLLHYRRFEETVAHLEKLNRLAAEALPPPSASAPERADA